MTPLSRAPARAGAGAPRLALIGCGAIAKAFHLPALARHPAVLDRLVLADPDLERARALAREFGAAGAVADYREVLDRIDGAIVTAPHRLHHAIGLDCLRRGVPILCEKPLAETPGEVEELLAAAEAARVAVAVNNTRRLIPACRRAGELIRQGAIGAPLRLEFQEGDRFDWPSASGYAFGRRGSGKGVLLDIGAHVLDLVCWWLGGPPELRAYRDDSYGGSEAVCQVELRRGGCEAVVRLSWLSKLGNAYRIEGTEGTIESGIYDWSTLVLRSRTGRQERLRVETDARTFTDFARPLIDNFLAVVAEGAPPLVSARDVLPSLALIDACYRRRERFPEPWYPTWERFAHA